jgi:transposase
MEHVAIDLGGRESQVCVRAADGTIVEEKRCRTRDLGVYLATRPKSRVIVETCAESFCVVDHATRLGHETRVVAATLVRTLGVGERGMKSDKRDARKLSEVSCRIDLPSVHVASTESRERKTMCGMREALVQSRTKLINTVRGWMRGGILSIRSGSAESLPARVRQAVGEAIPSYVARQLDMIEALTEQIAAANKQLRTLAKSDSTCPRLMSVPGVGPITALRYVAALDSIERFPSAHHAEAYLGLTPGEASSSERQRRTGITKAGSPAARWVLVQAAWAARRAKGDHPIVRWSLEVEKRRGKRVAILALARKIAGIMFAIWRDGTVYERLHAKPIMVMPTASNT